MFNLSLRYFLLPLLAISLPLQAESLPRSSPEDQGVDSDAISTLLDALGKLKGVHSVMALRHGQVIAEGWWKPYDPARNHVLYSLSKSFTSTAVGLAVADGKLNIDDPVLKFFPEDAPAEISANLKAMKVRDLLTMSAGHDSEISTKAAEMCAKLFLAHPVPFEPGTHFKYNTPATFMQSAIVQKVTGQTVLDYLKPRLLEPLGIENVVWDKNFQGINLGGYGLRVKTEDIAKFGQLYLQKGQFKGKQLIPANWVAQATSKQVSNGDNPKSDWAQGYGFQFWRCQGNAFRGDGAFGQLCVVMPDQDAVVAVTSGMNDLQGALNVLWEKFVPFCQKEKLSPNAAAVVKLKEKAGKLELPMVEGTPGSSADAAVLNHTFVFAANEQKFETLTFKSAKAGNLELTLKSDGNEDKLNCGHQSWEMGRGSLSAGKLGQMKDEPIAGTYAWDAKDPRVLIVKLCAVETPYINTLKFTFSENGFSLAGENNVSFGPTKWAPLQATVKP